MARRVIRRFHAISVFAIFILLFNVYCFAGNNYAEFTVESVTVEAEAEICEVAISLINNPGIAAGDFEIKSDLQILSIEDEKFSVVANETKGLFNWSSAVNKYTTGEIVKVIFILPEKSDVEQSWIINLTVNDLFNENVENVQSVVNAGLITRTGADVNGLDADIINFIMSFINFVISFFESIKLF